ncbi:MAG: YfhO family protein [Verrucomicrobia bacterium]|nr:YfhO family protein [Verrucomicrobiota bacterium]
MKSPGTRSALREFLIACAWLAGILALIFHRSFEAEQVLFSNDGPLGLLVAYSDVASSFFKGAWHTLNWIGIKQPSALPNVTVGAYFLWGPLAHAKFFTPLALLVLGLGAWTFFRQLRFHPAVCTLGALAALLNTGPFSYACWGLPATPITLGAAFFAFAALVSPAQTKRWLRIALAGFALGMAIMEGYDVGAFFSLYVAAFVVFQALAETGPTARRLGIGAARVAVVAICAALLSASALSTLIGTQIKGIVGTQQDAKTKEQRWDEATQWSLPKAETLRVVIPGVFGYRMDTPDGGNYWGAVGQSPGHPTSRHSGSGVYCGVLVVLVAMWTLTRAARKSGSLFSDHERKFIWFWAGAALVSLLLAYGRHAPLYQFFYKLPYFSTIRNPIKFMHPFSVALVILFGYGLQGLYRQYLGRNLLKSQSLLAQLKSWWAVAPAFERKWAKGLAIVLSVSGLAFLLYLSSQTELRRHLETAGFPGELGAAMARFSIREVAWFVLFLALSAGAVVLIVSGALSGARAKWAGIVLGAVLVTDFSHANAPWIIHYNYKERYAANPVLDILRDKPHEHRVAARLLPMQGMYLTSDETWPEIYQVWLEHLFQYYRIQSLDIIQMPRTPEFDFAYLNALRPKSAATFSFTDFKELSAFAAKLKQAADPVSQFLWSQLSDQTRARLSTFTTNESQSLSIALASELNRVIEAGPVYHAQRFGSVALSPQTKAVLARNAGGDAVLAQNRLLLEDAYPAELVKMQTKAQADLSSISRLWQLTNTRYILGMRGFFDFLNQQIDPIHKSFRGHSVFGSSNQFALFEYGAALPRTKLYSQWQAITNSPASGHSDQVVLQRLADPAFDPAQVVLVSDPVLAAPANVSTNQSKETVAITHYEPRRVTLKAENAEPRVLLLNDRYDSDWKVAVNGQPKPLLRCNYIMRGVYLPPGTHTIEFRYDPPAGTLYVSLAAIVAALAICGVLMASQRNDE